MHQVYDAHLARLASAYVQGEQQYYMGAVILVFWDEDGAFAFHNIRERPL